MISSLQAGVCGPGIWLDAQHGGALVRIEHQPQELRMWIGKQHLLGQNTVASAEPISLGVADLMAMDTTLHHLSLVVQGRSIFVLQRGVFFRRREIGRGSLLGCQAIPIRGIMLMQLQRPFEGGCQSFHRNIAQPLGAMRGVPNAP